MELDEPFVVHRIVERDHGDSVPHLAQLRTRLGTDTLGGRVGRDQLGMFGFQSLEFSEEPIVLGVRNLRIVEYVVAMIVMADLGAQRLDALDGLGAHHRRGVRFKRSSFSSTA
jgi:hypothetical protein